jgi:hypothetical protein
MNGGRGANVNGEPGAQEVVNGNIEEAPERARIEGDDRGNGPGHEVEARSAHHQGRERDNVMFGRMRAAAGGLMEVPEMQEVPWMKRLMGVERQITMVRFIVHAPSAIS